MKLSTQSLISCLALASLVFPADLSAQTAQGFSWAKQSSNVGYSNAISMVADAAGNSYVTGTFGGTISFDTVMLTETSLEAAFVAKYNAAGQAVWARKIVGINGWDNEGWFGVASDAQGNTYATGTFNSQVNFDGQMLAAVSQGGDQNIYVAKYGPSGSLLWTRAFGGSSQDYIQAIAVDASGNSYLLGMGMGLHTFGNSTIGISNTDSFVLRYDTDGNPQWAAKVGESQNTGSIIGHDLAVSNAGEAFVAGSVYGTVQFNGASYTNTSSQNADWFLAKIGPTGTIAWGKAGGTSEIEYGAGLALDQNGNSYLTGKYGTRKIDAAGNEVWSHNLIPASPHGAENTAVTTDNSGNAVITGVFSSAVTIGTDTYTTPGNAAYAVGYSAAGAPQWVHIFGEGGTVHSNNISADSYGGLYLSGYFKGDVIFGATPLSSPSGNNWGHTFLAKAGTVTSSADLFSAAGQVRVYPNPFSDNLQISNSANGRLWLTDLLGRTVWSTSLTAEQENISLNPDTHLPVGTYLLLLEQEGNLSQLVVVKQ